MELIVEKFSNKTYGTQPQKSKTALIKRIIFEKAIKIKAKTIEDVDKENELKCNRKFFYLVNRNFSKKVKSKWKN